MSYPTVGWPIYSDAGPLYTPSFSGGSWQSALPLTNLADWRLSKVARSADVTTTSTTFDVDLGVARPVFVIALVAHSCTSAATVRVRGSSVSGSYTGGDLVYDTTTLAMVASGITVADWDGHHLGWFHVAPSAQSARYWRVEINDNANADGYLDLGRLALAGGWQPTLNMDYGAVLGLESESQRTLTDGGSTVHNVAPVRRTLTFAVSDLDEDEALAAFQAQRLAGIDGQVVVVYDAADSDYLFQRAFLATFRDLSPLRAVPVARYGTPLSFAEVL